MNTILDDLRFGLRMFGKNPGFTIVAIITLALGIGANTAMFSVVYGVLLRPLPYPHPDRIAMLSRTYRGQVDYPAFGSREFAFWQERRKPFAYLSASTDVGFNLAGGSHAERVEGLRVSSEYFHVLGIQPVLGRDFRAEEDRLGGANVVILSNGLWRTQFGADPRVIGKAILLDGNPYTVVGVMPAGFASLPAAEVWTTIGQVAHTIGSGANYEVMGRLKAGVTREQASAFLDAFSAGYVGQFLTHIREDQAKQIGFGVFPRQYVLSVGENYRTPLLVLLSAIGFVLLIACVNVANLQMARASTRNREIAVRTALGAGRWRLFRQLLTENVLLGFAGGAVGLFVAEWGLHFLLLLAPADLPRANQIFLDRWALGFTALVAIATGILFGLAPALAASKTNLNESLKEGSGRSSMGRSRRRLAGGLISVEFALSLVLLISAGLLIKTFAKLFWTDPGFDPHHVLSMQIWTTGGHYKSQAELANFYESMVDRIQRIPGVRGATVITAGLPLERGGNLGVQIDGRAPWRGTDYREVTPGYFSVMGIPLLRGRHFTGSDSADATKVAVINQTFAGRYFPGRDPLGAHIALSDGAQPGISNVRLVAGVAGDIKSEMNKPVPPTVFIPVAQADYGTDQLFQGWYPTSILLRAAGNPLALSRQVERAVKDANPDLPVGHVRSMEQVLSVSLAFQRLLMTLMSLFAGLALVLAAVGIYGVLSYWVSQQTREIGIRMALGARKEDILRAMIRRGLGLAAAGIGIGLAAALLLSRLIASQLYGVKPDDPVTFVSVSIVLAAVALFACYIPARRATKVDPIVALRYE
ncbi:MAG TPA: ABC transporter permease [Terriglobia bacterium]|nr:ABC transporter permease [Terriglobia bacterium]